MMMTVLWNDKCYDVHTTDNYVRIRNTRTYTYIRKQEKHKIFKRNCKKLNQVSS